MPVDESRKGYHADRKRHDCKNQSGCAPLDKKRLSIRGPDYALKELGHAEDRCEAKERIIDGLRSSHPRQEKYGQHCAEQSNGNGRGRTDDIHGSCRTRDTSSLPSPAQIIKDDRSKRTANDGTVKIEDGVQLFERARDILLAAACATVKPRAVFHSRKPQQA